MKHKDYLIEMNFYDILNSVTEVHENYKHERRDFNELSHAIENGSAANEIELRLDDFLHTITRNYFCRGLKMGMEIAVATPANYTCDETVVKQAMEDAAANGGKVIITTDAKEAAKGADAIYTDTWVSMGQEDQKAEKVKAFSPYQVNSELFSVANKDAIFLHCLPAYRGMEVTEEIIDGPHSVVFDEAENRLHAQKAVMAMLMG